MTGSGEKSGRSERSDRAMGAGRARTNLYYGKAIERLRRERGMTRDDLAAESGVSPSYLYEVERGYKRPSTDVLASLAEALGRSPSEMLAYIEVMSEALPETPRMETPSPETGSLRALLAVLEYLSEDDLRILLALARRLAGKSG